ncbi:MAG: peptidase S41, partial [Bacteroidaceae bacterium]
MQGLISLAFFCLFLFSFSSCIREEEQVDSPQGNFEALWTLIDQRYCFFDVKNVDWAAIHDAYAKRITSKMPEGGLFEVLGDMLEELQDGHVNLYSTADVARYWDWYENYPHN